MKKFLLISVLFLGLGIIPTYGQDLTFDYDASGNQVYRGPDDQTSTSAKIFTEDTLVELEKKQVLEEKNELIKIAAAPNPTSGVIVINWKNTKNQYFVDMSLHTYSNTLLLNAQLDNSMSTFQIDLSTRPPGIYIAVFTTNKGNKQPYRIIKK